MDQFLKGIYCSVFHQWILYHLDDNMEVTNTDNRVEIETETSSAHIGFYEQEIIEMQVISKKNDTPEFYLHFQMQNLKHATDLFEQMKGAIRDIATRKTLKVMLSCSSGLTTSLFASMLEEAAQSLGMDATFEAVGFTELMSVGDQYDIILLAPQISYQKARAQAVLKEQIVINMPAQVFAKYDTGQMITIINNELTKKREKVEAEQLENHYNFKNETQMLIVTMVRSRCQSVFNYRIYDHDDIIYQNQMIKENVVMDDLCNVFDVVFAQYPGVEVVCVSMPGMFNKGIAEHSYEDFNGKNVEEIYKEKYNRRFIFINDSNSCVIGLHASLKTRRNVSFYILGRGNPCGGVGTVLHNHLVNGLNGIAGEIRLLPAPSEDAGERANTIEGTIANACYYMRGLIGYIGPEVVGLYSDLIPDVKQLIDELKKYVPEQSIPEIIKINDPLEYMQLGTWMHAVYTTRKK